jgi:hypothetical protein
VIRVSLRVWIGAPALVIALGLAAPCLRAQEDTSLSTPLANSLSDSLSSNSDLDPGLLQALPAGGNLLLPTERTAILDPLFSSISTGPMSPYAPFGAIVNASVSADASFQPATDTEELKRGAGLGGSSIRGWRTGGSQFAATPQQRFSSASLAGQTAALGPGSLGVGNSLRSRAAFAGDTPADALDPLGTGAALEANGFPSAGTTTATPAAALGAFGPEDPYLHSRGSLDGIYPPAYSAVTTPGTGSTFAPVYPELGTLNAQTSIPQATSPSSPFGASLGERSFLSYGSLEHPELGAGGTTASHLRANSSPDSPFSYRANPDEGYSMRQRPASFEETLRYYRRQKLLKGDTTPLPPIAQLRREYERRLHQYNRPADRPLIGQTP